MEQDELLPALEAERHKVADLLDGLDRPLWASPSLCTGWTVHQVAAHLSLTTRLSVPAAILGMLRARGNIDRMIGDAARDRAAEHGPDELVAQIRQDAASSRRPFGTQPHDPLVDILVHGQDIARPLGRELPFSPEHVTPALDHAWASSFYGARKRFAGLRFAATDVAWSAGTGDLEVRGPGGELLLLLTGRPAGLAALGGSGLDEAAARVAA